ncbi:hypothetical protein K503DRAFT_474962 [Rhizopogon vinicolor AM-OR11-026]|uniref:Uncharacterized protein n=1 Tax=Rhizopogon vinicolor AM-OR11-026 TaxID=1314800 RepID=A0A1B7MN50_9AGAM|nr:hypothetical protein K503DRAFT_474962 [Rhizopogon vinicolor AM-OR11-026]
MYQLQSDWDSESVSVSLSSMKLGAWGRQNVVVDGSLCCTGTRSFIFLVFFAIVRY